jgi:hypothetical protein
LIEAIAGMGGTFGTDVMDCSEPDGELGRDPPIGVDEPLEPLAALVPGIGIAWDA